VRGVCLRVFIFPSLKRMPAPPFYSSRERSGYKENGIPLVLATVWSDFGGMAPVLSSSWAIPAVVGVGVLASVVEGGASRVPHRCPVGPVRQLEGRSRTWVVGTVFRTSCACLHRATHMPRWFAQCTGQVKALLLFKFHRKISLCSVKVIETTFSTNCSQ
jgi:hypothetical protein